MTVRRHDPRLDAMPAHVLPLLYIGTAHVSLAFAFACVALWPYAVTGFFYHSWMIALIHLVTLGWITLSITGVLYIVAPVALQLPLPVRRGDYVAYALLVIGMRHEWSSTVPSPSGIESSFVARYASWLRWNRAIRS